MIANREALLNRIRALLAKTISNGCTQPEALAALAKARAMMDAYEVTEEDLQLAKEEAAILRKDNTRDPHGIKWELLGAIAKYCECEAWRGPEGFVFCGLKSDADYASWLLDHLTTYVQGELANYLMRCPATKGERRHLIKSYVIGATSSINEQLRSLSPAKTDAPKTCHGRDLVVIRTAAIADKMNELGITVRTVHRRRRYVDPAAYDAGVKAGKRASIGRPVSGAASERALTA